MAATAVAAARFRARLAGQSDPAGERTARVLAGYRRTAGDRGRGQARPFSAADLAAVLATCHLPRRRGRGVESDQVGETNDVRYLKNGAARAVRTLRSATSPKPADRVVPLSAQMIGLRFTAAGIERRVTAHSGMEGARERGCTGSTSLVIADYRLRPDPSIERHPRHPLNSQDERCCP